MIHFDFIVSDIDAENIMSCITQEINSCNSRALELEMVKDDEPVAKWYRNHAIYLKELASNMKNTRIDE